MKVSFTSYILRNACTQKYLKIYTQDKYRNTRKFLDTILVIIVIIIMRFKHKL
jgi:hypothetical protein